MSAEQSTMLESLASAEPTEVAAPEPTPEPVKETAPEPKADVEKEIVDTKTEETREKLVPLKALQEEREAAKELKRQIQELQQQPKLTAEDAQLLKDLKAQRDAPKPEAEIDFVDDPKGYVDAQVKRALAKFEEADTKVKQIETAATQREQLQSLVGAVQAHEAAYVKATPDYLDALTHMRTVRNSQLKMLYPQATDQQIGQAIMQEELQTAANIIRQNGNPAEFAYNYAKTIGYVPKEAAKVEEKPEPSISKDAGRSLGGNSAAEKDTADAENPMPEFTQALMERFGKKRR